MKLLKTLSLVALSIFVVSCGGKNQTTEPQEEVVAETPGEYNNDDLGIKLKFDPTLLALAEEDSTQVIFKGIEGKAVLRIYKDVRTDKAGNVLSLNDCFKQDEVVKPGHRHAMASFRSDSYLISGRVGDELYYQKSYFKRGGVMTAILTYPDAEKETYNVHYLELFGSIQ